MCVAVFQQNKQRKNWEGEVQETKVIGWPSRFSISHLRKYFWLSMTPSSQAWVFHEDNDMSTPVWLYFPFKKIFLLFLKKKAQHKICRLCCFQVYGKFVLTLCILLCIRQISSIFYLAKQTLCPLTNSSPSSCPSTPGNHHSTFCLYDFDFFGYFR